VSRVIAVTGSASGIGRATTALLTEQGARVVGIDLHDAEVCADLTTAEGRAQAVAETTALAGGSLDALITCAGLSQAGPPQVNVNFFGTTELVDGLRPALAAETPGRVVLVGSVSAMHGHDAELVEHCLAGAERAAVARAGELVNERRSHEIYSSTKVALGRWLRLVSVTPEYAGAGIPVNAVAPGVVLTPMTEALVRDPQMREVMDRAVPMPLGGHAPAEAVAGALVWLASPENTHMTGQVVHVDGGAHVLLTSPH
jgi:NAD(P)-dependent dehydrogenase (short-subunit alcohol dehydrogenase family)